MKELIKHIEDILDDCSLNEEDYINELYYILNKLKRMASNEKL